MKSNLLAIVISLSTVAALAGTADDLSNLSPVQPAPEVKAVPVDSQVAFEGSDQKQGGPVIGDEDSQDKANSKARGKGKGKAKGHYKDRETSADESSQTQSSTASTATPAAPAPAASPAPAPVKAKESVASSPTRSAKEINAEVEKRVRRISAIGGNDQASKAGLAAVAKETGLPLSTLQAQHKQYDVGNGGLLVCNELAKATGKPADTFLKQRRQNRDWDKMAAENKVDLSTVLPKLERVQASMEAAQKTKKR